MKRRNLLFNLCTRACSTPGVQPSHVNMCAQVRTVSMTHVFAYKTDNGLHLWAGEGRMSFVAADEFSNMCVVRFLAAVLNEADGLFWPRSRIGRSKLCMTPLWLLVRR